MGSSVSRPKLSSALKANPELAAAHDRLRTTLKLLLEKRAWDNNNVNRAFGFAAQLASIAQLRQQLMLVTPDTPIAKYAALVGEMKKQLENARNRDVRWRELYARLDDVQRNLLDKQVLVALLGRPKHKRRVRRRRR